jgi:hypothetical protein
VISNRKSAVGIIPSKADFEKLLTRTISLLSIYNQVNANNIFTGKTAINPPTMECLLATSVIRTIITDEVKILVNKSILFFLYYVGLAEHFG